MTNSYLINKLEDYSPEEEYSYDNSFLKSKIEESGNLIWEKASGVNDGNMQAYSGRSGVAYMFWYMSLQEWLFSLEQRQDYLKKALTIIDNIIKHAHLEDNKYPDESAYLKGCGASYLIASLIFNSAGKEQERDNFLDRYAKLAYMCLPVKFHDHCNDDFMMGRAGYICGALIINKTFHPHLIPPEILQNLSISTMKSGSSYSQEHDSKSPLMFSCHGNQYLGELQGMSGILLSLLSTPNIDKMHPDFENDIKQTVNYLLSLQTRDGNFPRIIGDVEHRENPIEWRHSVVWLMAKAYIVYEDYKYLYACIKYADLVWEKGLLKKGAGISHGMAGNGYVFLLLYRLTNDLQYVYRARQFATLIFSCELKQEETPNNPYSLFEGMAGTVCYLIDVLKPEKALFPIYFDIFAHFIEPFKDDLASDDDISDLI